MCVKFASLLSFFFLLFLGLSKIIVNIVSAAFNWVRLTVQENSIWVAVTV